METNIKRLSEMIETLAGMTETPDKGVTRFSYSKEDKNARDYLIGIAHKLNLSVNTDAVGNIFIEFPGTDSLLPSVITGSHIDSVHSGGRFDGIVGSVGALEAVNVMIEEGYKPKNTIYVVFFAEEEGSNFHVPVMGSKTLVGKLGVEDWKNIKNADGISAYEVAKEFGLNPDAIPDSLIAKDSVKACVELHIEQSVRLEEEGHEIGIVEGIAGLNWLKITLSGVSNHAGATPMNLRNDPMVTAANVIAEISEIAKSVTKTAVATVGSVEVIPNIPNAIPEIVSFTVDIRDIEKQGIENVSTAIEESVKKYSELNGVSYQIESIATSEPIKIQSYMIETMKKNAETLGLDYVLMPSGAVHDSNYMAEVTDVGMIFVPSVNGRSHVPEEYTDIKDIKVGADLLLATIVSLTS